MTHPLTEAQVADRYLPMVNSITWKYLRRYPWTPRDDIYSDALVGLARAARGRRLDAPPAMLTNYVQATVDGACQRGVRTRARAAKRNGYALDELPEPAAPVATPISMLVHGWLDTLTLNQRRAVVLCWIGGYTQSEAGAMTGVTQMSISRWLRQARTHLQAEDPAVR